MPPKRDGNITAFFQPKSEAKGKSKAGGAAIESREDALGAISADQESKSANKTKRTAADTPFADKGRPTKVSRVASTCYSHLDLPLNWVPTDADQAGKQTKATLSLPIHKGDLFGGAPKGSLLIHACNTQGSWGAGIARAFQDRYPKAYAIYRNFCTKTHDPKTNPIPTGTALLIPPVDTGERHWIGCLFTSAKYGRAKAKPDVIVKNTVPAMQMLLELVRVAEGERDAGVTEVRMCKINAGLFNVPWEKTAEALESIETKEGWRTEVEVWEP